jgi:hypothetical protein
MSAQTAHFPPNQSRNALYRVLKLQGALRHNSWGRPVCCFRPEVGEVTSGQEGDELHAFGEAAPDRRPHFSLHARIVQLVPGTLIVLAWKNMVWNYALDPNEITDLDSTVVLTFKK